MAALCSKSEKSVLSIEKKLSVLDFDYSEVEQIIQKLIQHNFLNEQRFANSYVRDKYLFNKWGRIKISHYLRAEGITNTCINIAMGEIEEKQYLENLRYIMQEKKRKTKGKDNYNIKMKVVSFAQSRGFEADLIFSTYNKLD